MNLLTILGGVGLILFGVRFLRKGLDRLFGGALVRWLVRATSHPLRAFAGGIAIGAVAPSSTGLTMLGAELLNKSGEITAQRMLAVLLGAGVGLTVTVQLLAFRIEHFAGAFIAVGMVGYQFCRRDAWRGVGQCLLAMGFVFLAMALIGEGARGFTDSDEIRAALLKLQGHPWLILATVSVMSVLLQSSTATIAFGLALAGSGFLQPAAMLPWIIGTNLGLGWTSVLMGWSQVEGRRLGVGNVIAKLIAAFFLIAFLAPAQAAFELLPGSLMRQTALAHTLFNLAVGLVALPFLRPLLKFSGWIMPLQKSGELARRVTFLEPRALDTPSVALVCATRETLRMADEVRAMLEHFWQAFLEQDAELARRVQKQDDVVDTMNLEIKNYLSRVGENRSAADTDWQFTLLTFSAELEAVGDLVDKHLCDALRKQRSEGVSVTGEDRQKLAEAYQRVRGSLDRAIGFLTTRGSDEAKALLAEKHEFNEWCRELQREHYERLAGASRAALASSSYFVDSLNALRRINSHFSTLGYSA